MSEDRPVWTKRTRRSSTTSSSKKAAKSTDARAKSATNRSAGLGKKASPDEPVVAVRKSSSPAKSSASSRAKSPPSSRAKSSASSQAKSSAVPSHPREDPIIIGGGVGAGDDGLRNVAAAFRACGVELSGPLDAHLRSLWAALLLGRRRWLPVLHRPAEQRPDEELVAAFELLRAMEARVQLDHPQLSLLGQAAADLAANSAATGGDPWAPADGFELAAQYLGESHSAPSESSGETALDPAGSAETGVWGFASPLVHLMLPEALAVFPRARYVHVVRHPFDAAWGAGTGAVRAWGSVCGVEPAEVDEAPQNALLAWWLHSTRLAMDEGQKLGDRFLFVRLEQLAVHPEGSARRLAAFAGVSPGQPQLREAAAQLEAPPSADVWKSHPLDELDETLRLRAEKWTETWEGWRGDQSGAEEAATAPSSTSEEHKP